MRAKPLSSYVLWVALACLLVGVLPTTHAYAQSRGSTLWLVDAPSREANTHEAELAQVLVAGRGAKHVVGKAGIEDRIQTLGLDVPGCLDGTAACASLFAAALQALDVDLVVRFDIIKSGTVRATAYDDSGKAVRAIESEARTTRQAILRAVAEITGATGTLLVDSEPRGARVLIDGQDVGVTPLNRTMAVGSYSVDVHLPGYAQVIDTMDVPPDGSTRRSFALERLQATLTVRSGTPGAYVTIDDDRTRLPLNEGLLVDPGSHRIHVSAPGYDTVTARYDFEPGHEREVSATLALSMEELTRRRVAQIHQRPIMLQVGLRYARFGTDWSRARVTSPGDDRIDCAIRPTTGECSRNKVNSFGIDFAAIYAWRYIEVEPLGLSFYRLGMNRNAVDYRLTDDPDVILSHVRARRTQLRIGHVGGRYLINEYIEPYGRAGFTLAFDRIVAEHLADDAKRFTMRRPAVLFEVRAGARAHLNQLLYGYTELGFGFDLRNGGTRPAFELGAGVGVNLPDPLRVGARAENALGARRQLREESLPEEL